MAAYMIVEIIEVSDPEGFGEYRVKVGPMLAKHGAKLIAMGEQIDVLAGDWQPGRVLIFEFDHYEGIRESAQL